MFVCSSLTAFSCVLSQTSVRFDTLASHIKPMLEVIIGSDFLQSENPDVLRCTLKVANSLIAASGDLCKQYQTEFFKIMLQLGALPQLAAEKE